MNDHGWININSNEVRLKWLILWTSKWKYQIRRAFEYKGSFSNQPYKLIYFSSHGNGSFYENIFVIKGIVRSFHQKNREKHSLWLQFIRQKTLHQCCYFIKKWIETTKYWKSWRYTFFTPLKFNKSHLILL